MPFEIVRNDITCMQVDAIVNTVSCQPIIGYGVDYGIHQKAGPQLLEARKKIGTIQVGECGITPAFELDANYVIHTVCPVWQEGNAQEERLLRSCYDKALSLALANGCSSIAFPLIAAGNLGFPKSTALQIAVNAISSFLMDHEMQIYLVVFAKDAYQLSEKLFRSVASYIDEHYIENRLLDEYGLTAEDAVREQELRHIRRMQSRRRQAERMIRCEAECFAAPCAPAKADLEKLLKEADAGFSETLLKLIDRSGKKDSEIYKKANVDRKLFSKIKNNPQYRPSKPTALAFALALELDLQETQDFIGRAGYTLTHSSQFDIIVEYFIVNKNYNIIELDIVLFDYDQPQIGGQ